VIDTGHPDYLRHRISELEAALAASKADLDSIASAIWPDKGTYSVTAIVEWICGARLDTKRLEWWINHPNAVLCDRWSVPGGDTRRWAVYFGPQPFSGWDFGPQPFSGWRETRKEALDAAIAKTENRKGAS